MGADEVVVNSDGADVGGPVKRMTGGRGADVVIEAVGVPEVWQLAIGLLRRGGVVNFFGGCPSGPKSSSTPSCCIIPRSPAKPASITRPR